jgi:hypothetical protein
MPRATKDITVFLESDELGYEEFAAVGWVEAISTMKELYRESMRQGDGITRKIGIVVPVGQEEIEELEGDDEI